MVGMQAQPHPFVTPVLEEDYMLASRSSRLTCSDTAQGIS